MVQRCELGNRKITGNGFWALDGIVVAVSDIQSSPGECYRVGLRFISAQRGASS
jgi:hypothetical protein